MATVTHRVDTASTAGASTYTSGSFTPAAGDLLVAFAVVTATTDAGAMTASANGITFTKVGSATKQGGLDTIYAFVANQLVPGSPSSMTVTMDVTGDAGTGAVVAVASVAGVSSVGAPAVRQFKTISDQTGIASPQIVFDSTPLTDNPQLGVFSNARNPPDITPPSSWTEGADTGFSTPITGLEYAYRDSGGTTATISWSSAPGSTEWGGIIVELVGATPASVSPPTAAATAAVVTPFLLTGAAVAASTVSRAAAIPAPALSTGVTVSPATVAATAAVGASSLSTGATAISSTVAAVASVGQAALTTESAASVSATTVATTGSVPAPILSTGTTVTPATVTTTAAVPSPVLTQGTTVIPPAVGAVVAVPAPAVSLGTTVTPFTVAAAAAVGGTPSVGITVAAMTVPAVTVVPLPPDIGPLHVDISFDVDVTRTSTVAAGVTRSSTTAIDPDTRSSTAGVDEVTRSSTTTVAGNRSTTVTPDDTRSSTVTIGEARQERGE